MTTATIVISSILGVTISVLLFYWIYLVYNTFKLFGHIMSMERKLAVISNVETGKEATASTRKTANSSKKRRRTTGASVNKSKNSRNSQKSKTSEKSRSGKSKQSGTSSKSVKLEKSKKPSNPSKSKKLERSKKPNNSTRSTKSGRSTKSARTSKSTKTQSTRSRGDAGKERSLKSHRQFSSRAPQSALEIRGPYPKIDRPPDRENFIEMVEKLSTFIKNYMKSPQRYPVSNDCLPGFLYQRLDTHPPHKPVSFNTIIQDFEKLIIPGMTHFNHPRFLAANVPSRSVPDIVGEVLAVHIGSPGFIYDASPAVAEMQVAMINWAGRALGIPERFLFYANSETCQGGGSFQESIGDSSLCALMVARVFSTNQQFIQSGQIKTNENFLFAEATGKNMQAHHAIYGKLCVYASSEAHPTLDKQCRLAMLRLRKIPALAENGYGMTAKQLDKMIRKDLALGRIPCCIIVTLGTDGILANDELGRIGRLGQKYNCWVHVMAHNVSSFWLEPKFRPAPEDLQYANSIMGQLPYHSSNMVLVWTKNQSLWKDGFRIFAQYLKPSKNFAIDERDWTIHLNRRFRGIKVWLNYRLIGLKRMREHINQICRLTAYLEEMLSCHPNIRLFSGRVLNCFCFTYFEKGLSPAQLAKYTRLLGVFLNESHRIFLKITNVAGAVVLSISISYEDTTYQQLDELYADLKALIRTFKEKKNDPTLLKFPPDMHLDSPESSIATPVRTAISTSAANVKEIGLPPKPQ